MSDSETTLEDVVRIAESVGFGCTICEDDCTQKIIKTDKCVLLPRAQGRTKLEHLERIIRGRDMGIQISVGKLEFRDYWKVELQEKPSRFFTYHVEYVERKRI